MRFVLAIVAFIVAAALVGLGIAQRTVLAPASEVSASVTVKGGAAFTVISGSVLNAHPNQQTLSVSGSSKEFVAYGRTADVLAWLGTQRYARISYDASGDTLTSKIVTPKSTDADTGGTATATPDPTAAETPAVPTSTPSPSAAATDTATPGPNPSGSDLWLEQYSGSDAAVTYMNVPSDVSVIVASDGTKPAPDKVRIAWPLDTATPWAGPLIAGGLLLLLAGIVLFLLGLLHLRRSRGPRRSSGPKMPKLPKARTYKPSRAVVSRGKGRRSRSGRDRSRGRRRMVTVSTVVLGTLVLTGCSADYWPQFSGNPTATLTPTPLSTDAAALGKDALPPVVTVPQLQKIVANIATVAANADAHGNADELAGRFTGVALAMRSANYKIRAPKTSVVALATIPAGPIKVALPQATDSWPRVVEAVVQNTANAKDAPIMLVLVQETPRDNYMVNYAIPLQASATVPDVAPASIGTSIVPPDSKFLLVAPSKLAADYADVLTNGDASKYADLFDASTDGLRGQVAKLDAETKSQLSSTASLTIARTAGTGALIALATNDSGAIVAVDVREVVTAKVVSAGAEVTAGATASALSGLVTSKTGIASTTDYQLLFSVPPPGSKNKITLLGFSQGLTAASEVQ